MPSEIRVPTLGESVVEATVGQWLKQEGNPVAPGEPVVSLETDKISVEVAAEIAGVLVQIVKQVGDTAAVGEVLGMVAEGAAPPAGSGIATPSDTSTTPNQTAPSPATAAQLGPAAVASKPSAVAAATAPAQSTPTLIPAAPAARRLAAEVGLDLAQLAGSGRSGRVTKEDVLQQLDNRETASPATSGDQPATGTRTTTEPVAGTQVPIARSQPSPILSPGYPLGNSILRDERVRMSRRRQTIAQRLVEAQRTAAMLTTFNEIDMSAVMDVRKRRRDAFRQRHNVGLGFMSFFTKASVGALKAFPRLNAEIQGDEMVLKYHYDIGIAVGAEEGLVVPVVRDADRKTFAEIEREIEQLAQKARDRKLALTDLQGGTFTITNGGVFGSLLSTPILNAPQVGILGLHKIQERPIALGGQVVIRPMMYVALSYDHRIVDGREAVQFLVRVKELMEDPETLLLEG